MGRINWARVILGGLLAGVVINIVETINGFILEEEWKAAMEALGKSTEFSAAMMVFYIAFGFGYGIFAVWLYAAIRPRFGPGPKTAVWAGLAVFFIGYLTFSATFSSMGLFPTRLLIISTVVGFVEIILATLLGAWMYKEA